MKEVSEIMHSADAVIEHDQSVSTFFGVVSDQEIPGAVITKDGEYLGMLNVFVLLRTGLDIATMKMSSAVDSSAPTLAAHDTLTTAAQMFSQTPLRTLAVLSGDEIVGIIDQSAVQNALGITAPDSSEYTVDTQATLGECLHVLKDEKQYALAVTQDDIPVGVLTLHDVLVRYSSHHQTRDEGMRPNQKTKAFTAENSSIVDLPIDSLLIDIDEDVKDLFVSNHMLKETIEDAPSRQLEFVGLDAFNSGEQASIKDLFASLYDKLLVHERYELKVHLKTYHDAGTQRKISVHLHAKTVHGDHLEANADEWGLEAGARSAMDKLEWQMRKLYV